MSIELRKPRFAPQTPVQESKLPTTPAKAPVAKAEAAAAPEAPLPETKAEKASALSTPGSDKITTAAGLHLLDLGTKSPDAARIANDLDNPASKLSKACEKFGVSPDDLVAYARTGTKSDGVASAFLKLEKRGLAGEKTIVRDALLLRKAVVERDGGDTSLIKAELKALDQTATQGNIRYAKSLLRQAQKEDRELPYPRTAAQNERLDDLYTGAHRMLGAVRGDAADRKDEKTWAKASSLIGETLSTQAAEQFYRADSASARTPESLVTADSFFDEAEARDPMLKSDAEHAHARFKLAAGRNAIDGSVLLNNKTLTSDERAEIQARQRMDAREVLERQAAWANLSSGEDLGSC